MIKNFRSFGYFVTEGIRNILTNGFMSIASLFVMVCCLLLTGISFLFSENIKLALKNIEGQNSITIYLKSTVKDFDEIKNKIFEIENVTSCNIFPKDEAMKEYKNLLGEKVSTFFEGEGNPLPDAFHVTMKDLSKYNSTIENIKSFSEVDTISDHSEVAQKLSNLKSLITIIGLWIVFALSVVSLLIVSNTIRVTLYNRRFEISIMKSIGATDNFVRMPFIIEGMVIGLIAALLSVFILNLVYSGIVKIITDIAPFKAIPFSEVSLLFIIVFSGAGVLFGLLAGVVSIKRYLRKEGGEVALW